MGRPIVDLSDKVFGKLTVMRVLPTRRVKSGITTLHWKCRCICGSERLYNGGSLKRGGVKSCGCSTSQMMKDTQRRKNPTGKHIDPKTGYVKIRFEVPPRPDSAGRMVTTVWRQEHTVVMEQKLGRSLFPDEEVHHKNTIRSDNHPDNLEVWVKSKQPKGGKTEDLLEWAIELVTRYQPDLLQPPKLPIIYPTSVL